MKNIGCHEHTTNAGKIRGMTNPPIDFVKMYLHLWHNSKTCSCRMSGLFHIAAWLRCEFCEKREGPPLSWLRLLVITPGFWPTRQHHFWQITNISLPTLSEYHPASENHITLLQYQECSSQRVSAYVWTVLMNLRFPSSMCCVQLGILLSSVKDNRLILSFLPSILCLFWLLGTRDEKWTGLTFSAAYLRMQAVITKVILCIGQFTAYCSVSLV